MTVAALLGEALFSFSFLLLSWIRQTLGTLCLGTVNCLSVKEIVFLAVAELDSQSCEQLVKCSKQPWSDRAAPADVSSFELCKQREAAVKPSVLYCGEALLP